MGKLLSCNCGDKLGGSALGSLILRVAVGVIFLVHGIQKYNIGVDGIGSFLGSLGVPLPGLFAYFVIALEIFGGLALIAGIYTHWAAKLFALEMLAAFFLVHVSNGFYVADEGYEFVLLLFAASITLMITGAGKCSFERRSSGKK